MGVPSLNKRTRRIDCFYQSGPCIEGRQAAGMPKTVFYEDLSEIRRKIAVICSLALSNRRGSPIISSAV